MTYPPWVVLHIPHDSTIIPPDVRQQFVLNDTQLGREIVRMTDHLTHAIFVDPLSQAAVVRAPVSRLVVDVERFPDDSDEPMAAIGMGAIYASTSDLLPLKRSLESAERDAIMRAYYWPHHARLESAVTSALDRHGRCLIIDCHSFPSEALPYERVDSGDARPDICVGTDDFHTPAALSNAFTAAMREGGWSVALNTPFAGALVPGSRYRRDLRVSGVMIEVNRRLYLKEGDASPLESFDEVVRRVRRACADALALMGTAGL